mgnify:CR=1 FL=1
MSATLMVVPSATTVMASRSQACLPMGKNTGKQFEKDMLTSVRSWGWWAERFRDNTWGSMQGSNASPPDMICVDPVGYEERTNMCNPWPILMELKAVQHPTDIMKATIPLSRCEGHQLERLLAFPGDAYVVVMFYEGATARKRSAVMIPVQAWVGAQERYGRLSVRLDALREDLGVGCHLRWVGRTPTVGPWVRCTRLGDEPKDDQ